MYTLDSIKLLKSVSGNQHHMIIIRWCIDLMYAIKKTHSMPIQEVKKLWPFEPQYFLPEALNIAPEYLSIITGDKDDIVYSRVLKYHFEQERILKQMGQRVDFDEISAVGKAKSKLGEQELEVYRDRSGQAVNGYNGMFPTRSYNATGEVFFVTGAFYSYLTEKYQKVDVDTKLQEIHHYFCEFESARRHHSSIKRYIEAWISGDLSRLNKIKKKRPQIKKAEFYKSFLNDQ